jgi:hypothetical protein
MTRQVLLPVRMMCMTVRFMCFELRCNGNELNILQKIFPGSQPCVSSVNFPIT